MAKPKKTQAEIDAAWRKALCEIAHREAEEAPAKRADRQRRREQSK